MKRTLILTKILQAQQADKSKQLVDVKNIKPGAIIITVRHVTPAEDLSVLLWPRFVVTHALMYAPMDGKVNNLTHAVTGKSFQVKTHSMGFYFSTNTNEVVHIFNPRSKQLGEAAARQIKKWESFGLNYDVRKFNQGNTFVKGFPKKQTIYTEFDPAKILQLVYRLNLPRSRPQKDRVAESGVTCHGLMMDVYNAVWLAMEMTQLKIDISPKMGEKVEYVSVKYCKSNQLGKYAKRPDFFPRFHERHPTAYQKQSENYVDDKDNKGYLEHPLGKHPYELIDQKQLAQVIGLAHGCPFPCASKWATLANLYDILLKDKKFFEHVGVLDLKTLKPAPNEKELAKAEEAALATEIEANRKLSLSLYPH